MVDQLSVNIAQPHPCLYTPETIELRSWLLRATPLLLTWKGKTVEEVTENAKPSVYIGCYRQVVPVNPNNLRQPRNLGWVDFNKKDFKCFSELCAVKNVSYI